MTNPDLITKESRYENSGTREFIISFAFITTKANCLLQRIGVKRMPVILSKSNETLWIMVSNHLSDVLSLLVPYPYEKMNAYPVSDLSLIHISEPTRLGMISYAVFCLKKKKKY